MCMPLPNQAFVEAVDLDELEASRREDQERMDADLAVQNEQLAQINDEVGLLEQHQDALSLGLGLRVWLLLSWMPCKLRVLVAFSREGPCHSACLGTK